MYCWMASHPAPVEEGKGGSGVHSQFIITCMLMTAKSTCPYKTQESVQPLPVCLRDGKCWLAAKFSPS